MSGVCAIELELYSLEWFAVSAACIAIVVGAVYFSVTSERRWYTEVIDEESL